VSSEVLVVIYKNAHPVAIKLLNTNQFKFEESNLRNAGYLLIEQNKAPQALEVFKLNSRFFIRVQIRFII